MNRHIIRINALSLFNIFFQYADLKDHFVLFKFQTSGVTDHVWIVLQAPGPKYKIYVGNFS